MITEPSIYLSAMSSKSGEGKTRELPVNARALQGDPAPMGSRLKQARSSPYIYSCLCGAGDDRGQGPQEELQEFPASFRPNKEKALAKIFKQKGIARVEPDERFRAQLHPKNKSSSLLIRWRLHENVFHGVEGSYTCCCNYLKRLVDLVGIEPTTSSMPWKRAPSCATGPHLRFNYLGRVESSDSARSYQIFRASASRNQLRLEPQLSVHYFDQRLDALGISCLNCLSFAPLEILDRAQNFVLLP